MSQIGKIAVIDKKSGTEIPTRLLLSLEDDGVIMRKITHRNGDPVSPPPRYQRWKFCQDQAAMAQARKSKAIARIILEYFAEQNFYEPTGECR